MLRDWILHDGASSSQVLHCMRTISDVPNGKESSPSISFRLHGCEPSIKQRSLQKRKYFRDSLKKRGSCATNDSADVIIGSQTVLELLEMVTSDFMGTMSRYV